MGRTSTRPEQQNPWQESTHQIIKPLLIGPLCCGIPRGPIGKAPRLPAIFERAYARGSVRALPALMETIGC
jgi:hypothetical protein